MDFFFKKLADEETGHDKCRRWAIPIEQGRNHDVADYAPQPCSNHWNRNPGGPIRKEMNEWIK